MENQLPSTPVIPNQPLEVVMSKPNNFLIWLLAVLLTLSVAIAAFFAFQTQKLVKELTLLRAEPSPISTLESTDEPVATSSSEIDSTANWKTYTSSEVVDFYTPFVVKYPSDWTIEEYKTIDLDQLTVVMKSQFGDTIFIRQGAGGGGTCVYYDDKDYLNFEGQAGYYTYYSNITLKGSDWRLSKNKDAPPTSTHIVCEKDTKYNRYIGTTRMGDILVNLKSENSSDEIIQILKTVSFKPTSSTKTLFD